MKLIVHANKLRINKFKNLSFQDIVKCRTVQNDNPVLTYRSC